MNDDIRAQYDEIDERLRPHWEQLVRAAHAEGLLCSGFIWGDPIPESDDPYLIRFGNVVANSAQEMFAIHYQLSVMAAKLELAGKIQRTETPTDLLGAGVTSTLNPLEIADKLALMLLMAPSEGIPPEVQEILSQYMACRRPPTTEEPKL
jgi:hypothetical protein